MDSSNARAEGEEEEWQRVRIWDEKVRPSLELGRRDGGRERERTREDWTSLEGGASTRNPGDGERKARTPVKVTIGLIQVPPDVGSYIPESWYLRRARRSFAPGRRSEAAAASALAVTRTGRQQTESGWEIDYG